MHGMVKIDGFKANIYLVRGEYVSVCKYLGVGWWVEEWMSFVVQVFVRENGDGEGFNIHVCRHGAPMECSYYGLGV